MGVSRSTAMLAAAGVAGAIGLGSPVGAQTIHGGYEFRVPNVVSPSQPTAMVEVWAWFDFVPGVSELFASAELDLVAGEGQWTGNFVSPLVVVSPGRIRGSSLIGVHVGQLHAPPFFFGNPSNPIWIFAAQWRTTDFTPRSVALVTDNTIRFLVVNSSGTRTIALEPSNIMPGSGEISVVPAPASLLVLSGALVMARRRRRRTDSARAISPTGDLTRHRRQPRRLGSMAQIWSS